MVQRIWAGLFIVLLAIPAAAVTTKSVKDGLTEAEIAALLVGPGASISNLKITGTTEQIGSFSDDAGVLGITRGVILSTGRIADAAGPNKGTGTGAGLGGGSQAALDAIVTPLKTFDSAVIEFDVVTESPTFAIKYSFASEEYLEYVGSEFNDVFGFFVNGTNIALAPGTKDAVTVNSINPSRNAAVFRDNTDNSANIEYDGFTTVLQAVALLTPGQSNHIRIAIADVSDSILDSAVVIAQGGVSGTPIAPLLIPDVDPVAVTYGMTTDVPITVYYATEQTIADLSASGLGDSTYKFSPFFRDANGLLKTIMTITPGPNTPSGTSIVTIRSAIGGSESFATIRAVADCVPPYVLGINQPVSASVAPGARAHLKLVPSGSGPYTIQWYRGFAGMTGSPIAGGLSAEIDTPAITEPSFFWARITNACGSVDSGTAFVSPN